MKIVFVLSIAACLTAHPSCGQEFSKADIIRFKIKSVQTIEANESQGVIAYYNEAGDVIKEGTFSDSSFHLQREYVYDPAGKLLEEREFSADGNLHAVLTYTYNNAGRLQEKRLARGERTDATSTYDYDALGNLVQEKQTSRTAGNATTRYTYDEQNTLAKQNKSNEAIGEEESITYTYNTMRQLEKKTTRAPFFRTKITTTYFYEPNGRLKKIVEKSSNGVSSTTTLAYNTDGLLQGYAWRNSLSKDSQVTTYKVAVR